MSIKVIHKLGDDTVQSSILPKIEIWYDELRVFLPSLPSNLQIYFFDQDDPGIMKEFGVGGYAYSPEIMSLGFLIDFVDREEQLKQLKSTIYHEGLHIAQGYTGNGKDTPLIECMIYEGLATVFEREMLGNVQPYGIYPKDEETLNRWVKSIRSVDTPWQWEDYERWGFIDPKTKEQWRLYKAGTWFIDQVLKNNKELSVLDLTRLSAKDILRLP